MTAGTIQLIPTELGDVAVHAQGDGPAVVLLHANPGDARDFAAVAGRLAADYRVFAVDWPGYGASPMPSRPGEVTAMSYAAIVPQILAGLRVERAVFIGNSVGGYAAARLALAAPASVTALVLVNSGGFTRPTPATRAFIAIRGTQLVTTMLGGRMARWYLRRRTPVVMDMIARDAGRRGSPAAFALEAAIWRSFNAPEHDLRPVVHRITAPTLLAWGMADPMLGRDGVMARRLLPHALWHPLPTGHCPFAEDPAAFLAAVVPFLAAISGPDGAGPT